MLGESLNCVHLFGFAEPEVDCCRVVKPMHDMLYTWADPAGSRLIYWEDNGKHIENDLRRDGLDKFK